MGKSGGKGYYKNYIRFIYKLTIGFVVCFLGHLWSVMAPISIMGFKRSVMVLND